MQPTSDDVLRACKNMLAMQPARIVDFVGYVIAAAAKTGCIWGDVDADSAIVLCARNGAFIRFEIEHAKHLFRSVCARLAAFANQHGCEMNPYGGKTELTITGADNRRYRLIVDIMNTPKSQWFRIQANPISDSPTSAPQ